MAIVAHDAGSAELISSFLINNNYNFSIAVSGPALKIFSKKLINKSILAYLISDKCISLISRCLFEMKWFGGTSFTRMISSDQMFDKHYLSTIHHPKKDGERELVNSFEKFINQEVIQIPLMKKINQRINKVIN